MERKSVDEKITRVVGKVQYINATTGEVEDFQVISKEMRDFNFHKIWLQNILETFEIIGNQKIKIAMHIVENLNSENQFIGTFRDIADALKCSPNTVNITIQAMLKCNFLRKVQNGVYMVNPKMIFKGSHNGRMNILLQYTDSKKFKKADASSRGKASDARSKVERNLENTDALNSK